MGKKIINVCMFYGDQLKFHRFILSYSHSCFIIYDQFNNNSESTFYFVILDGNKLDLRWEDHIMDLNENLMLQGVFSGANYNLPTPLPHHTS